MEKYTAYLYKHKVYEGMSDYIHGGGRKIKEIFVPHECNLIINSEAIFECNEPRENEYTTIEISKELYMTLVDFKAVLKEYNNKKNKINNSKEIDKMLM